MSSVYICICVRVCMCERVRETEIFPYNSILESKNQWWMYQEGLCTTPSGAPVEPLHGLEGLQIVTHVLVTDLCTATTMCCSWVCSRKPLKAEIFASWVTLVASLLWDVIQDVGHHLQSTNKARLLLVCHIFCMARNSRRIDALLVPLIKHGSIRAQERCLFYPWTCLLEWDHHLTLIKVIPNKFHNQQYLHPWITS